MRNRLLCLSVIWSAILPSETGWIVFESVVKEHWPRRSFKTNRQTNRDTSLTCWTSNHQKHKRATQPPETNKQNKTKRTAMLKCTILSTSVSRFWFSQCGGEDGSYRGVIRGRSQEFRLFHLLSGSNAVLMCVTPTATEKTLNPLDWASVLYELKPSMMEFCISEWAFKGSCMNMVKRN